MKKIKKSNKLLFLIIAFFGSLPFARADEDPTPEWQKNAMDWMQGASITEDWFMKDFLGGYKAIVWGEYGVFIDMAKVIGSIMATIYFSIKAYEMWTGDKKLDIIPLLRPFGLCLVLMLWKPFVETVSLPTNLIADVASEKYEAQQRVITNLRYKRAGLQSKVVDYMYKTRSYYDTTAAKKEAAETGVPIFVRKSMDTIIPNLNELKMRLEFQIQLMVTQLLETIALWILRIAVYGLFLIQIIYSGVLIMFGPFAVAMAIHPSFRDSFVTWISRFISVNLYLGIGYIVLYIAGILQRYALESEIKKFTDMIVGEEVDMSKYMYMQSNGLFSFGTVIICFILSAVAVVTIPSISTWIVSTSGVTSAVSTASRAGNVIAGKMGGAVTGIFK